MGFIKRLRESDSNKRRHLFEIDDYIGETDGYLIPKKHKILSSNYKLLNYNNKEKGLVKINNRFYYLLAVKSEQQLQSSLGSSAAGAVIGGVLTGGIGALVGATIGAQNNKKVNYFLQLATYEKPHKLLTLKVNTIGMVIRSIDEMPKKNPEELGIKTIE